MLGCTFWSRTFLGHCAEDLSLVPLFFESLRTLARATRSPLLGYECAASRLAARGWSFGTDLDGREPSWSRHCARRRYDRLYSSFDCLDVSGSRCFDRDSIQNRADVRESVLFNVRLQVLEYNGRQRTVIWSAVTVIVVIVATMEVSVDGGGVVVMLGVLVTYIVGFSVLVE